MKRALTLITVVALVAIGIARPWSHDVRSETARPAPAASGLIASLAGQRGPHGVDQSTVHTWGAFHKSDGKTVAVAQALTNDHENKCVVTSGGGLASVGCDPAPFADVPVQLLESFAAGPGGKPFHEWQVTGLALPSVARIELVDSAGRRHPVELTAGGAFFFELSRADLVRGVTAVSLLAYGADGALIKEVGL
jgi:hypothetical protein